MLPKVTWKLPIFPQRSELFIASKRASEWMLFFIWEVKNTEIDEILGKGLTGEKGGAFSKGWSWGKRMLVFSQGGSESWSFISKIKGYHEAHGGQKMAHVRGAVWWAPANGYLPIKENLSKVPARISLIHNEAAPITWLSGNKGPVSFWPLGYVYIGSQ